MILKKIKFIDVEIRFIFADDGDLAVELFKTKNKLKNEEKIDLIVMDLNMKKMNGDEATR